MRVLIVSHNVFSATESMGKTLMAYFSAFKPEELAQFYIHSQVPTQDNCSRYYRMTDKEAIKSIIGLKTGSPIERQETSALDKDARTDTGITASLYQRARKRTPLTYLTRNLWWKLSHWNSKQLRQWLDEFSPDCVFLASGDYAFIYDIALKIAKSRKIPLYVSCMDDFYFYNKNERSALGRLQYRLFMNSVRKTIGYACRLFCICDKMSEDYSTLFGKECITIHTPATIREPLNYAKKPQISYLGNLGYQRDKQLIEIGRALKRLNLQPVHIDVYSSETRPEILSGMNEENGILFHGSVSAEEVHRIIGESLAVIHTESFDDSIRKSVRYSVSTKIADSLVSGTCIFAYGPEEIASISYLKNNHAAVCCTSESELSDKLCFLIQNDSDRKEIISNALVLARNHAVTRTPMILKEELKS